MIAVTALNFIKLEYVDEFKKLADELVAETRKENSASFGFRESMLLHVSMAFHTVAL